MKSIVLKTGETARVFTDFEWSVIQLALKEFKNALPQARGECE
jgi:hypothetical protein